MDLSKPCSSISEVVPQVEMFEQKTSQILLQKCWLASFKPGQFDQKITFWSFFFFPWTFPSVGSGQFSRLSSILMEVVSLMFSLTPEYHASLFPKMQQPEQPCHPYACSGVCQGHISSCAQVSSCKFMAGLRRHPSVRVPKCSQGSLMCYPIL